MGKPELTLIGNLSKKLDSISIKKIKHMLSNVRAFKSFQVEVTCSRWRWPLDEVEAVLSDSSDINGGGGVGGTFVSFRLKRKLKLGSSRKSLEIWELCTVQ